MINDHPLPLVLQFLLGTAFVAGFCAFPVAAAPRRLGVAGPYLIAAGLLALMVAFFATVDYGVNPPPRGPFIGAFTVVFAAWAFGGAAAVTRSRRIGGAGREYLVHALHAWIGSMLGILVASLFLLAVLAVAMRVFGWSGQ